MASPITCQRCRYFRPDASNPNAAMGRCLHAARHGYWFAGEHHYCRDFNDTPDAERKPESSTDA